MSVLVDSSVWIAAAKSTNKECFRLKKLIQKGELIYITKVIQVEVCQGARTVTEFHKLWDGFLGFDCLEATDKLWGLAAWNYFQARKKGQTLTTLDCFIGTLAKEYRIPLWTLDKALLRSQRVIGFEVYE